MALICEVSLLESGDTIGFVAFARGLYLLPHRQTADSRFGLVWCRDCDSFGAGEVFESSERFEARRAAVAAGEYSPFDRMLTHQGEEEYVLWRPRWRSAAALRRWRRAPPRCARCRGTNFVAVDGPDPKHPKSGDLLELDYAFGDSDFNLLIYSCDGEFLGEISGYDERGRQINSVYPYAELALRIEDAGIAIDGGT